MNKKIVAVIEGNIPSYKAHSVTTVKMADAISRVYDGETTLVSGGSLLSIMRNFKFKGISNHYGVDKKLSTTFLHCPFSKKYFTESIGIPGVVDKFKNYFTKIKNEVELVYARSFKLPLVCMDLKIPVVLETHASEISHPDFIEIIQRSQEESFRGIITIHEKLKEIYVNAGVPAEKILVAHDGFSSESFKDMDLNNRPEENALVATYIGGLFEEKGLRVILDLAIMANNDNLPICFKVYGGEPHQVEFWKNEFKNMGGQKNLQFYGYLPNSKVPKVLVSSNILMMPYPKMDKFDVMDINTTSPLKLFEYMASQTAILSTDIPVVSSVLSHKEEAYLANLGDIDDHYKGLLMMINNVEFRNQIATKAHEKSLGFSWEKRSEELLRFFKE
jgi:glycosyltransferase involved in cell wall biosynthesis